MQRLVHIDALRGIAMLLVVYSHVLFLLLGNSGSEINHMFIKFRMPLFFFISGFFVYNCNYSGDLLRKRSRRRLIKQLYPTLVLGSLFAIVCYSGSYTRFLFDVLKCGYWFTIVAVEMFFITAPLLYLFNKKRLSRSRCNLILTACALLCCIFTFDPDIFKLILSWRIGNLLCLAKLLWFMPFFIAGVLFRSNFDILEKYLISKPALLLNLLLFFFLQPRINHGFTAYIVGGVCGIGIMYYLSHAIFTRPGTSNGRISNALQLLGRNTLEIYLLHYFIINLGRRLQLADYIKPLSDGLAEFPIVLACSICISAVCLLTANALKRTPLRQMIFPDDIIPQPIRRLGHRLHLRHA